MDGARLGLGTDPGYPAPWHVQPSSENLEPCLQLTSILFCSVSFLGLMHFLEPLNPAPCPIAA